MATSHKTHNIPQKENLTLWYDMSSPACINPEGLFEEDLTTYQKRKDAFAKHMGVLIDQNSNYLRTSSRDIYQFGYKDLSGNGHHMALAYSGNPYEAWDTATTSTVGSGSGLDAPHLYKKPFQRVILPLLDKGQGWHFNIGYYTNDDGQAGSGNSRYTGSEDNDSTRGLMWAGQNLLNGTYTPVGKTADANNFHPDSSDNDTQHINAHRMRQNVFQGSGQFKGEALNGPTYARITHTSKYINPSVSQTDWQVTIAGKNYSPSQLYVSSGDIQDTNPPPTSLKPGMIVSIDSVGDWEVGPPIMAGTCFFDKYGHYEEESTYTADENDDDHFSVTPGSTWHPLRPIRGNKRDVNLGGSSNNQPLGTFKQNQLGIDVLGRAKTPIRKRKESRVANQTYIYRDITVNFDEVAPNLSSATVSPIFTTDVNTIYVKYGTASNNSYHTDQRIGVQSIHMHPELVSDLRDVTGGKYVDNHSYSSGQSGYGDYAPSSNDISVIQLFDEYGHEVFDCNFKLTDGNSPTVESVPDGDREGFIQMNPYRTNRSMLPTLASGQKGTADWYGSRKFTLVIVMKPYTIATQGSYGYMWDCGSSEATGYPYVEYDNYGNSNVPGFFPTRKDAESTNRYNPSLQHGAICDSLYWDGSSQSTELTCNLWARMPENPFSSEISGDQRNNSITSYRFVTPLIDFGAWGLFIKSSDDNGGKRQLVFRNRNYESNDVSSGDDVDDFFVGGGTNQFTDWTSEHLDQLVTHRQWFQVTATFSNTDSAVKLYINGEELSGVTMTNYNGPAYQHIGDNNVNRSGVGPLSTKHGYLGHTSHSGNNFSLSTSFQRIFKRYWTSATSSQKGVTADMDFGVVQIWRNNSLNASEIKQLFNIYAPRFNRNKIDDYVIDSLDDVCRRTAAGEAVPVQKDNRHPPHGITQRVSSFTSLTPVTTVIDAINTNNEDRHWQDYGQPLSYVSTYGFSSANSNNWNPIDFECFAVAELGKVSTNLPVSTNGAPTSAGWRWDSATADIGSISAFMRGSHYWGDSELNTSIYDTPLPYMGIACFDKTGYLGATFMFFKVAGSTGATDQPRYDSSYDNGFFSSYMKSPMIRELFNSSATNRTTSTFFPANNTNLFQIEGYTHDVSGYYEVNGKPSSIDNPYIVKTTTSGENSTQSWKYTINSGITGSLPYISNPNGGGYRTSLNGGVFGWKPGEKVYGYRPYAVNDIWGIANWTGDDSDSVASWGPNKTFEPEDQPRFYMFYQRGKNRKW